MPRPTFLIIGAQKAGTTSLTELLRCHPQVSIPARKELAFFNRDDRYAKGVEWYEAQFLPPPTPLVLGPTHFGEATPTYCCDPKALARIHAYDPGMKLIFILRDPVERAESQYWHSRRKLNEALTFDETLAGNLVEHYRSAKRKGGDSAVRNYFSRGVYIRQIEQIRTLFPAEKLLVLFFEDLKKDPAGVFSKICGFLEISDSPGIFSKMPTANASEIFVNPAYRHLFKNPRLAASLPWFLKGRLVRWGGKASFAYPPMPEPTRQRLEQFFEEPNRQLAEWLDDHPTRIFAPVPRWVETLNFSAL